MSSNYIPNIEIEGAKLIFKNFSGKDDKFDRSGKKFFSVVIDSETADQLLDYGWNIKFPKLKPEVDIDMDLDPYLKVNVRYEPFPPKIWLICGKKKTLLNEDTVKQLQHAIIKDCDVVIGHGRPSDMYTNAKGIPIITAYVKEMYVEIQEDRFASKYSDYVEENEEEAPF